MTVTLGNLDHLAQTTILNLIGWVIACNTILNCDHTQCKHVYHNYYTTLCCTVQWMQAPQAPVGCPPGLGSG